jgi:hypothetical protein
MKDALTDVLKDVLTQKPLAMTYSDYVASEIGKVFSIVRMYYDAEKLNLTVLVEEPNGTKTHAQYRITIKKEGV